MESPKSASRRCVIALAMASGGILDLPLSVNEVRILADWSVGQGKAPLWRTSP